MRNRAKMKPSHSQVHTLDGDGSDDDGGDGGGSGVIAAAAAVSAVAVVQYKIQTKCIKNSNNYACFGLMVVQVI